MLVQTFPVKNTSMIKTTSHEPLGSKAYSQFSNHALSQLQLL